MPGPSSQSGMQFLTSVVMFSSLHKVGVTTAFMPWKSGLGSIFIKLKISKIFNPLWLGLFGGCFVTKNIILNRIFKIYVAGHM